MLKSFNNGIDVVFNQDVYDPRNGRLLVRKGVTGRFDKDATSVYVCGVCVYRKSPKIGVDFTYAIDCVPCIKQLTVAEIEAKLGYKVEVVS